MVTVFTANVQSLPGNPVACSTYRSLLSGFDLVFLQEVRSSPSKVQTFKNFFPQHQYSFYHAPSIPDSTGGTLTFCKKSSFNIDTVHLDPQGRFIILMGNHNQLSTLLVNIYGEACSSDPLARLVFIRCLAAIKTIIGHRDPLSIELVWLGGDLNCILMDSDTSFALRKPRTEAALCNILTYLDLFDTIILAPPGQRKLYHTYSVATRGQSSRLDRLYIKARQIPGGTHKVSFFPFTDHKAVSFHMKPLPKGSKSFCFPSFLLQDISFMAHLHTELRAILTQNSDQVLVAMPGPDFNQLNLTDLQLYLSYHAITPTALFVNIIETIQTLAVNAARRRFLKAKQEKEAALNTLATSQHNYNTHPTNHNRTKLDLDRAAYQQHCSWTYNRTKTNRECRDLTQGERSSAYFFKLIACKKSSINIPFLNINQTPPLPSYRLTDPAEIQKYMEQKYQKLCLTDPLAGTKSMADFLGPTLYPSIRKCSHNENILLSRKVTVGEIRAFFKSSSNNSAPGPDGLNYGVYKVLLPQLEHLWVSLLNSTFFDNPRILPHSSFKKATVVFIRKQGIEPSSPEGYRDITLLNCIQKVMSGVISKRAGLVIRRLTCPVQMGFMLKRSCSEAIRPILDCLIDANKYNKPLVIMSMDIKKAFPSISINHMLNSYKEADFPESYIEALNSLMKDHMLAFSVNGLTSSSPTLRERGSGQGDPGSTHHFVMGLLALQTFTRLSETIPRYKISPSMVPILQSCFADDAIDPLDGSSSQPIIQYFHKIREYYYISGLEFHPGKATCLMVNLDPTIEREILEATHMKNYSK